MEIIRLNFHLSLEEGDFIYGISLAIYFYYIGVSTSFFFSQFGAGWKYQTKPRYTPPDLSNEV